MASTKIRMICRALYTAAHTAAKNSIVSRTSAVRRSGKAIGYCPYRRNCEVFSSDFRLRALAKRAWSVFAITLNFGFLLVIGVGAIVAAVFLFGSHHAFAPRVGALASTLGIHVSSPPEPSRPVQLTSHSLKERYRQSVCGLIP